MRIPKAPHRVFRAFMLILTSGPCGLEGVQRPVGAADGVFVLKPSSVITLDVIMAKAATIKIKLLSEAGTGFFYVAKKNARTKTDKLEMSKYDPVARKHVKFKETKIK